MTPYHMRILSSFLLINIFSFLLISSRTFPVFDDIYLVFQKNRNVKELIKTKDRLIIHEHKEGVLPPKKTINNTPVIFQYRHSILSFIPVLILEKFINVNYLFIFYFLLLKILFIVLVYLILKKYHPDKILSGMVIFTLSPFYIFFEAPYFNEVLFNLIIPLIYILYKEKKYTLITIIIGLALYVNVTFLWFVIPFSLFGFKNITKKHIAILFLILLPMILLIPNILSEIGDSSSYVEQGSFLRDIISIWNPITFFNYITNPLQLASNNLDYIGISFMFVFFFIIREYLIKYIFYLFIFLLVLYITLPIQTGYQSYFFIIILYNNLFLLLTNNSLFKVLYISYFSLLFLIFTMTLNVAEHYDIKTYQKIHKEIDGLKKVYMFSNYMDIGIQNLFGSNVINLNPYSVHDDVNSVFKNIDKDSYILQNPSYPYSYWKNFIKKEPIFKIGGWELIKK